MAAYVLSYASANCMLAYMQLHRGIRTIGALLIAVFISIKLTIMVDWEGQSAFYMFHNY